MAATTPITISLQAKDWETTVSLIFGTSESSLRKLIYDLSAYYAANGNPQGNTLIPITTKEKVLVRIFELYYGNTVSRLYNDVGGSSIKRVMDAIRAANNAADNYIATELAAMDSRRNEEQNTYRKIGREYIMMEAFDNN